MIAPVCFTRLYGVVSRFSKVRRKVRYFSFLFLFPVIVALTGCNKPPILIGFSMNFSGPGGGMAVYVRDGALLAVEEINRKGGISGRPLKLLVRNDKGTLAGILEADSALADKGVVAIIGHRNAHDTFLAVPLINRRRVLLVGPACATSRLTGKDDFFVRTTYYNDTLSERIFGFFKKSGTKRVLCVIDRANDMFSLDLFEKLHSCSPDTFYPFYINSELDPEYPRGAGLVTLVAPQAFLFITSPEVTSVMAQKIREAVGDVPFYATTWAQTEDLYRFGGKAVIGMKFFTFVRPHNSYPPFQKFVKTVKEMGMIPNVRNALGYEAVMVIAKGLARSGNITSKALKEAIVNTYFDGVIDPLKIDKYGDPHRSLWLVALDHGGLMKTLRKVR